MMVGSAVIIMLWEMHAAAVPDIMMPSTSVRFPLGAPERRACDRALGDAGNRARKERGTMRAAAGGATT